MHACPGVEPIEQLRIALAVAVSVAPSAFVAGMTLMNWRARAERHTEWRVLRMLFGGVSDKDNRRVWARARRRAAAKLIERMEEMAQARGRAYRLAIIRDGTYRL